MRVSVGAVLVALLAVLVGRDGVLLGLFVLPVLVVMGGLVVVMRGGIVLGSGIEVVLGRGVLMLVGHCLCSLDVVMSGNRFDCLGVILRRKTEGFKAKNNYICEF